MNCKVIRQICQSLLGICFNGNITPFPFLWRENGKYRCPQKYFSGQWTSFNWKKKRILSLSKKNGKPGKLDLTSLRKLSENVDNSIKSLEKVSTKCLRITHLRFVNEKDKKDWIY